jgi:hypothetical protein
LIETFFVLTSLDARFEYSEWATKKAEAPLGAVPYATAEGRKGSTISLH